MQVSKIPRFPSNLTINETKSKRKLSTWDIIQEELNNVNPCQASFVFVYHHKILKSFWFSDIQTHPPEVFYKKTVFKIFGIFLRKHRSWSLLIKLLAYRPARLKRDSCKVFSCEYCKIFKIIYFEEHLWWLLLNIFRR